VCDFDWRRLFHAEPLRRRHLCRRVVRRRHGARVGQHRGWDGGCATVSDLLQAGWWRLQTHLGASHLLLLLLLLLPGRRGLHPVRHRTTTGWTTTGVWIALDDGAACHIKSKFLFIPNHDRTSAALKQLRMNTVQHYIKNSWLATFKFFFQNSLNLSKLLKFVKIYFCTFFGNWNFKINLRFLNSF